MSAKGGNYVDLHSEISRTPSCNWFNLLIYLLCPWHLKGVSVLRCFVLMESDHSRRVLSEHVLRVYIIMLSNFFYKTFYSGIHCLCYILNQVVNLSSVTYSCVNFMFFFLNKELKCMKLLIWSQTHLIKFSQEIKHFILVRLYRLLFLV